MKASTDRKQIPFHLPADLIHTLSWATKEMGIGRDAFVADALKKHLRESDILKEVLEGPIPKYMQKHIDAVKDDDDKDDGGEDND